MLDFYEKSKKMWFLLEIVGENMYITIVNKKVLFKYTKKIDYGKKF